MNNRIDLTGLPPELLCQLKVGHDKYERQKKQGKKEPMYAIAVRFPLDDFRKIEYMAFHNGYTISKYLRQLILTALSKEDISSQAEQW